MSETEIVQSLFFMYNIEIKDKKWLMLSERLFIDINDVTADQHH